MTAIRRRRPGDAVVDVVLDSGETVRVHDRRVVEHRLGAGTPLGAAGLDALRRAAAFDAAELRALRLIARRPRSAAELRDSHGRVGARRCRGGRRHRTAAASSDRWTTAGSPWRSPRARRARGYGRRRTAGDLARLAVDDPAAAAALAALPDDERPDAERVARPPVRAAALRRSHRPTGGRVPGAARIRPRRRRSGRGPPEPRLTALVAAVDGARLPSV